MNEQTKRRLSYYGSINHQRTQSTEYGTEKLPQMSRKRAASIEIPIDGELLQYNKFLDENKQQEQDAEKKKIKSLANF